MLVTLLELSDLGDRLRQRGNRIAFVCGHFDILHMGHLRLLQEARALADHLVVGIYNDGTTRLRKGPGRPVLPEDQRFELVAGLRCVDDVTVVEQDVPDRQINLLKPDIYVHGGDCKAADLEVPAAELVRQYGGKVVCIPLSPSQSTARLLDAIRNGDDWIPEADRGGGLHPHLTNNVAATVTFTFALDQRIPAADGISRPFTIRGTHERDLILSQIRDWRTFFEIDVLQYLAAVVPSGGVMLDIGANIGNHSIFLGTYLAGLVIAVEPAPELAALLRHNLAVNDLHNVIVLEQAAGAKSGSGYIVRPYRGTWNSGATRVQPVSRLGVKRNRNLVDIATVDSLLVEFSSEIAGRPVSLLKLDVEGDEYAVLFGARRLLEQHRPHLLVELTKNYMFQKVAAFLGQYGYAPVCRFGSTAPAYHFVAKDSPH